MHCSGPTGVKRSSSELMDDPRSVKYGHQAEKSPLHAAKRLVEFLLVE